MFDPLMIMKKRTAAVRLLCMLIILLLLTASAGCAGAPDHGAPDRESASYPGSTPQAESAAPSETTDIVPSAAQETPADPEGAFSEIIGTLSGEQPYVIVRVGDQDILAVAENGTRSWGGEAATASQCRLYAQRDGRPVQLGVLESSGEGYPLACDGTSFFEPHRRQIRRLVPDISSGVLVCAEAAYISMDEDGEERFYYAPEPGEEYQLDSGDGFSALWQAYDRAAEAQILTFPTDTWAKSDAAAFELWPELPPSASPWSGDFRPHVLSSIYTKAFGEEFRDTFYAFCDAALAGEDSFPCPDTQTWFYVMDAARTCLPVASHYLLMEEDPVQDGRGLLTYSLPREEYLKEVSRFSARVTELIRACVAEGDSETERAVSLFCYLARRWTYDTKAAEESIGGDIPTLDPWRILMGDLGICQEAAGAYAYLLLQTGVDAFVTGALTRDASSAHEWTQVCLDGAWYHCDVTYTMGRGDDLSHFGMTDAQREIDGDYPPEYFNVGEFNVFHREDVPAEDDRFSALWTASAAMLDRTDHVIRYGSFSDVFLDRAGETLPARDVD